jgi:nascent polypeptide-associated complex subunit alpha
MMRGNREMRRMLDKMGLDMKTMDNVEEVIIKTETKELYLIKPQVIEMKGKDSTIFQVIAFQISWQRERLHTRTFRHQLHILKSKLLSVLYLSLKMILTGCMAASRK